MTRCFAAVLAAAGAGLGSPPVHAHHAIFDVYDEERMVVLEGQVATFVFGNPHSMVHVRVPDGDGHVRTWAVEWRAASRLRPLGWTAGALAAGDRVRMCGNPGRDPGAYRLHLLNVTRIAPGAPAPTDTGDDLCAPGPPTMPDPGSRPGSHVRLGSRATRR